MDIDNIWSLFLEKMKEQINQIHYDTWFSETKLISLDENCAKVLVPMPVHKKHLKENYNDLIVDLFTEITGTNFNFEYVLEEELKSNVIVNTDDIGVPPLNFDSNLDPRYTFDNFIMGESNKFAKSNALAVAERPGTVYNPVFIYGKSGLGKTHLMHALGNYIAHNTNMKVLYVTSEQFVDDFVNIYRKNKNENNFEDTTFFKKKYRDIDVLMIDDIQYLEIAGKTQQAFFNTFNELHRNNKQIIISSDRSPDDLNKLEERLRTRFYSGLTINILPPDFKLRMDIIDKKIETNNISGIFPYEVKEYIAANCTSDIRRLEGAIIRVSAFAVMMNGADITLDLAIDALKDDFVKNSVSKNKVEQVKQIVAEHYNISIDDLKSKKKSTNIAVPRQIAMYICRTVLEISLPKIGLEFGGKDHTTVMHSVEKIKKEIANDESFKNEINKLISKIK